MRIALDAMGGDHAPSAIAEGAIEVINELEDTVLVLVGDEPAIMKELGGRKFDRSRIEIRHASEVIGMGESALSAIRKKKDSSIRRAVEMVKAGEAEAVVSAGHSGVAMALSLIILGKASGVERPAIAAIMPAYKKPFVLLDAGANVDCSPVNLLQFALMGNSYAKLIFGRPEPRVGLLSIGEEAGKGNELTKEAFKLLKESKLNFIGNIEGKDIFTGDADVVVCDGFVGNIVLKTSEGLAETIVKMLKREVAGIAMGRMAYLFIRGALKNFKRQTDYDEYGGAPLLGINGACIISHGRSTSKAIKNAVKVASEFARKRVQEVIIEEIKLNSPARGGAPQGRNPVAAG